jgi:hypothetical protein
MIRISLPMIAAGAAMLLGGRSGYANILSTTASVRPDNALIVEVQVNKPKRKFRVSPVAVQLAPISRTVH